MRCERCVALSGAGADTRSPRHSVQRTTSFVSPVSTERAAGPAPAATQACMQEVMNRQGLAVIAAATRKGNTPIRHHAAPSTRHPGRRAPITTTLIIVSSAPSGSCITILGRGALKAKDSGSTSIRSWSAAKGCAARTSAARWPPGSRLRTDPPGPHTHRLQRPGAIVSHGSRSI